MQVLMPGSLPTLGHHCLIIFNRADTSIKGVKSARPSQEVIANLPLHLGHPDPLWPGNKVWGQQLECFTLVGYSITHQLSGRLLPIFTLASKRFKKHTKADCIFFPHQDKAISAHAVMLQQAAHTITLHSTSVYFSTCSWSSPSSTTPPVT